MKTLVTRTDTQAAAELLRAGQLVAVPTETVYGLAANGLDADAVGRIYEVKGRPENKPLSLMVGGAEAMERYCEDVPEQARLLADKFWPGPLTIVLKAKPDVPEIVRAGGNTVGLRCPQHPLTLDILRRCALPLAAPSANPSGLPSPKTAGEVLAYFEGRIAAVVDGGDCGIGRESTIIDMSAAPYRILRRGALPEEAISAELCRALTVIGITGGSGTGKTTALGVLNELGALTIDCDRLYHELTQSSEALREALEARFGAVYENGVLDRKRLAAIVFSDPAALSDLNRITHAFIDEEVERRLREFAMSGGRIAALDAAAMLESERVRSRCQRLYAVLAPREERLRRIMLREGISREYAEARISAQRPDEYYAERCDAVLYNDGTQDDFKTLCRKVFKEDIKTNG